MNKRLLSLLAIASIGLASCVDTERLYERGAYLTGTFVEHVYDVWEGATKQGYQNLVHQKELTRGEHGYFAGNGPTENVYECWGNGEAKKYHPDYFKGKDGQELHWGYYGNAYDGRPEDIINNGPGVYADQSPLYDSVYSQNKRLDRNYPNFSRGYLSKLYNGQIKCNGWSYYAMMVLSKDGYGTMFPYELADAEYFATAVLSGTDQEIDPRIVRMDIHVTFYKYASVGLEGYQVSLRDVDLSCNAAAARTSLVGFTFADAGISPRGIVGMSLTYDIVLDTKVPEASNDFSKKVYHDGLAVYEVLFPDSTWY